MSHLSSQSFGSILDHLADVIEGGNAYAGGTSYLGMPGTRSNDDGLRVGTDGSFVASGTPTATIVPFGSGNWDSSRWVKASTPGFFVVDNAQNAARRITGWSNATKQFTTDAFPAAPANGRLLYIRQGFKRHPNHIDIEADDSGAEAGYDRTFALDLSPGVDEGLYGNGTLTKRGDLVVRLRILKYDRFRDARQSVVENIAIIAAALRMGGGTDRPNHRDGTYIRAILPAGGPPEYNQTQARVVATMRLPLVYRIGTSFA